MAALASVLVLAGCGGGGSGSEPTAADLYAQQIQVGTFARPAQGVDPDEQDRSSTDVTTSIRSLGNNRYQITVQNFSNAGFINSFWWNAGNLMRIAAVTGSSAGSCHVETRAPWSAPGLRSAAEVHMRAGERHRDHRRQTVGARPRRYPATASRAASSGSAR